MRSLKLLVLAGAATALENNQHVFQKNDVDKELVQPLYKQLDLGAIKPTGWLQGELELEAAGLAGNMYDFYRFVHDSKWLGGSTEYSNLDESSPYWFNALVPLAFGLPDERIEGQVKDYLDYVLDHQQSDGWIGFETTRQTRGIWARCLLFLGLIQYADADPTQTDRIVDAMYEFVDLAHSMLKDNFTGLLVHGDDVFDVSGFGVGRAHELHIPLQWLHEKHPRDKSQVLWETMELMIEGSEIWGADWRKFWTEEAYPKVYKEEEFDMSWVFIHGVNHAQGLRYPLAIYRMTHDEELKKQTRTALDLLGKWHKGLHGSVIGDEYISDLGSFRGSELCIASEMIFSLSNIYQYLGDNDIADWAEQVAFNAQPASVSSDWWSHQYVQQENQPWARNLSEGGPFQNVNSYGIVFGLEPDFPCCTVNHPQAYPKFLANSFLQTKDGIAHTYLVSGSVSAKVGNASVEIVADTNYPFSFDISYSITATAAFVFYVRIPEWASASSTITGPDSSEKTKLSANDAGYQKVSIPEGRKTTFSVSLDTKPRVEERGNNTVGIYYGALLYSLAIEYDETEGPALNYDNQTVLPGWTTHEKTRDHKIVPKTPWNVAIDPTQIKVVTGDAGELPSPVWTLGAPPVELRIAAVEIDWPLEHDTPTSPPDSPKITGKPFSARFVPYGSAKLHMSLLPVVSLEEVDLSD